MLSFDVLNPGENQASPDVFVYSPVSDDWELMHPPGGGGVELFGIEGFNDPMLISSPEFTICKMGQSSPVSSRVNLITITMQVSVALLGTDLAVIQITNLTGAEMNNEVSLRAVTDGNEAEYLFCGPTGQRRTGTWIEGNATLQLQLCPDKQMRVHELYTVAFEVMNPTVDQDSPRSVSRHSGRL